MSDGMEGELAARIRLLRTASGGSDLLVSWDVDRCRYVLTPARPLDGICVVYDDMDLLLAAQALSRASTVLLHADIDLRDAGTLRATRSAVANIFRLHTQYL